MVVPTIFFWHFQEFFRKKLKIPGGVQLQTLTLQPANVANHYNTAKVAPRSLDDSIGTAFTEAPSSEDPVCNYNTVGDFVPDRYSNAKNNLKARECESFRTSHAMFFLPTPK